MCLLHRITFLKQLSLPLEKKRSATASKLFQVYEQLGTLAKQFPEYSDEDYSFVNFSGSEFHVNAAEPVDYYGLYGGMGEIISLSVVIRSVLDRH